MAEGLIAVSKCIRRRYRNHSDVDYVMPQFVPERFIALFPLPPTARVRLLSLIQTSTMMPTHLAEECGEGHAGVVFCS